MTGTKYRTSSAEPDLRALTYELVDALVGTDISASDRSKLDRIAAAIEACRFAVPSRPSRRPTVWQYSIRRWSRRLVAEFGY